MHLMRIGPAGGEKPAPHTLVGPDDPVRQPRGSTKLDWEVELGIDGLGSQRQQILPPR